MKPFEPKLNIQKFYPKLKKKTADEYEANWRKYTKCRLNKPCRQLGCPVCECAADSAKAECIANFHARRSKSKLVYIRVEKSGFFCPSLTPARDIKHFTTKAVALMSASVLNDREWFGLVNLQPRWIHIGDDDVTDPGFWNIDAVFYTHLKKDENLLPVLVRTKGLSALIGNKLIIDGYTTDLKDHQVDESSPRYFQFETARESYDELNLLTFDQCLIDSSNDGYSSMFLDN